MSKGTYFFATQSFFLCVIAFPMNSGNPFLCSKFPNRKYSPYRSLFKMSFSDQTYDWSECETVCKSNEFPLPKKEHPNVEKYNTKFLLERSPFLFVKFKRHPLWLSFFPVS